MLFLISEELKKIPSKPGVYLMIDESDKIIYIGKAKILKNRVKQYFQAYSKHSPKVATLVKHIKKFEYIVTDTEVEALILENNLIKKHEPKYNIRLKDDKTYPYVKITVNEMFPRVFITRKHDKDKAKYFGPFTSSTILKENLDLILSIVPIRRCSKKFPRDLGKERPCLNYHIEKCKAPCNYHISKEEYDKNIKLVIDFFSGKHENILKKLETEMLIASENLEFEKAAELRNKLFAIQRLKENQIAENMNNEDRDVIAFARAGHEAMIQVFFIRSGKITGREHFLLNNVENLTRSELITDFVKQFYSGTPFIPKEIIVQEKIEDETTITDWLSAIKGQKVSIINPQKNGEKLKLVEMAHKNALISLERFGEQIKREQIRTVGALEEIAKTLNINRFLERIEAYDISNTQGVENVGSMVVFENGRPKRSDYRKFKIKSVFGANDYASMQEVIQRRFLRYIRENKEEAQNTSFNKMPDIIFLDGGKGQISAVEKVLKDLNINVLLCGMVKDDFHRTRGLLFNGKEYSFNKSSEGFKLITRIQDEVHRFAIEYHRKLRQNNLLKSVLDDIKGIGSVRKKALLNHFGSIAEIKKAEIDELLKVDTMNLSSSQAVYNFFRNP